MSDKNERKPGASLAEVAQAAGVSKMTASRVLRNASGFSEATRDKVMREVKRLGYVPNRIASTFGADGVTTLVGVCVPRLTSGLFSEVVESIDQTLERFGYQTMIGVRDQSPTDEEAWLRGLLAWRPAGVILTGRARSPVALDLLRSASVPIVEIWDLNTSPLDMSVGFNHFDCGFEMGRFLISRGRKHIGYVGASNTGPGLGAERLNGLERALDESGQQVVATEILKDAPRFYAGYYGTENLINRQRDLDTIYFQNDAMAIGGLFYCQANGLHVPDDIGIAGWGGLEVASILPIRLTTTAVPTRMVGQRAAEALMARLRDEPSDDVQIVPTRLVPGATL